jgi:hypothetical protein
VTERMAWRRAVERSREQLGPARETLLKHASTSRSHFHDDQQNLHAYSQDNLSEHLHMPKVTIWRHLKRAEEKHFLRLHRNARKGQQAVYHYVVPGEELTCDSCETKWPRRPKLALQSEESTDAALTPHQRVVKSDVLDSSEVKPLSLREHTDEPHSTHGLHPADCDEHPPDSSVASHFADHNPAASPASDLATDTAPRPTSTTGGRTPDCRVCRLPLHPALYAAEPWHLTHPACDLDAAAEAEDAAAHQHDPEQLADAGLWTSDADVPA